MIWQYSNKDPLTGASNAGGVWRNRDFLPIPRFISEMIADGHSYYGMRIGNCTQASEWYHFQWAGVILSDLAKYSMTGTVAWSLYDSWASCCLHLNVNSDQLSIMACNQTVSNIRCRCITNLCLQTAGYDTIRYDNLYLTWSKKLTGSQLSLPHRINKQELSYRKQIARQLRTQYVEGIYRPKYYTVTLKSRLRVTQGHWKRNRWTDHTWLTISRVIWR